MEQSCEIPGNDAVTKIQSGPATHHTYRVELACALGGQAVCAEPLTCTADDGQPGYQYEIYEDGADIGTSCLSDAEHATTGDPSPGQIYTAAKSLAWPEATLVIQPPGGETLVNFATNFYSTSTKPVSQHVTLLGVDIEIEATPSTYTWSFGDGQTKATSQAGGAYPHLAITHRYLRKGKPTPSLDVTYSGRYRIGTGPWAALPGTLTVAGTPQQLTVLTATPHLVDSNP